MMCKILIKIPIVMLLAMTPAHADTKVPVEGNLSMMYQNLYNIDQTDRPFGFECLKYEHINLVHKFRGDSEEQNLIFTAKGTSEEVDFIYNPNKYKRWKIN